MNYHVPLLLLLSVGMSCGPSDARPAQRALLEKQVPRIKALIAEDRTNHRKGIQDAASRSGRHFLIKDKASRERRMRAHLTRLREPPRGVPEFIVSPKTFIAAIDNDGVVIARDSERDSMKGDNFAERYSVIRAALEGHSGMELAEFPGLDEGAPSSFSVLFASPVRYEGDMVGAMAVGIPLWREAQRLSRQLRIEAVDDIQQGLVVWVYFYKGDRIFSSPEAPPEVNESLPDANARNEGLGKSPGGFTGEFHLYGRWYAFAVVPITSLGEDVGIITLRGDAPS